MNKAKTKKKGTAAVAKSPADRQPIASKRKFVESIIKTGLAPDERLLIESLGKDDPRVAHIKPRPKGERTKANAERLWKIAVESERFLERLTKPKEVAAMLAEYNLWRRGWGKYAFHEDPKKNAPEPFSPKQLGMIIHAAVKHLERIAK